MMRTPVKGTSTRGSPMKRSPMKYTSADNKMKFGAKHGFFIWCLCLVAPVLYFHSRMADEVGQGLAGGQVRY